MNFEKYLAMPNVKIPLTVLKKLEDEHDITKTEFEDMNSILTSPLLQEEIGYTKTKTGDLLVSVTCPMPNVTPEMINWWFWWHAQEPVRYQLWYPHEHLSISYDKKQTAYFKADKFTKFEPNTHYPVEKIGGIAFPLQISFMNPTDFGFDEKTMAENGVGTILCANIGAFKGLIEHSKMCHIFFERDGGLFLVSRFWLGKTVKNKFIRKFMLIDKMALDMAKHCYVEYRNLAIKLPSLYEEFGK
ncbi:MAG: hypothetical protein R3Y27_07825 [Clostridia bacterium]